MRASQDDLGPMKGLRPRMRRQRNSRAQGASRCPHMGFPLDRGASTRHLDLSLAPRPI